MLSRVRSLWKSDSSTPRSSSPSQGRTVRPVLEELERREVPSANPLDALLGEAQGLVPINFLTLANQGNQLVAQGQVGANSISVPLTLTATPGSNGAEILNLHLGPINLDVLGLHVQTSEICLNVTAQQGSGNLLGNLLYDVAHALDTHGNNLGSALNSLNFVEQFLAPYTLASLLNGGIDAATAASALGNTSSSHVPPNATDVAFLSVGPLNLNLLGLNVALNNCANPAGPVTVDVFATNDGLVGNLLADVTNALNPSGHANPALATLVGDVFNFV